MIVAEPSVGNLNVQSPTSLGTFQLFHGDAMTKFSHKCSHSVEATSSMNKENITVSVLKKHRCHEIVVENILYVIFRVLVTMD